MFLALGLWQDQPVYSHTASTSINGHLIGIGSGGLGMPSLKNKIKKEPNWVKQRGNAEACARSDLCREAGPKEDDGSPTGLVL